MASSMAAQAPQRFVDWLCSHEHVDHQHGHVYRYHSRSDAHSIALCRFILSDLLEQCTALREAAAAGRIVYGINAKHTWKTTGKKKTLDLAIGTPVDDEASLLSKPIREATIDRVLISCEAKTVMTEHGKSQPRVFDELGSSHEIVHQGDREAIAAGITVVNIAGTFVSPLRQKSETLHVSRHKQPHAAQKMIEHLRGLPIRTGPDGTGFDAYATIVVNCDNQGPVSLWSASPAPQPGDRDDYDTFVRAISQAYGQRFGE